MAITRRAYGPAAASEPRGPESGLRIESLEKNQILRWKAYDSNGTAIYQYAIVRGVTESRKAIVVPVQATTLHTRCYDENGAKYETDKDKVLLRYSTELFEDTHKASVRGCYVVADNDHPRTVGQAFLDKYGVDDMEGVLVDARDAAKMDCHPWPRQLQREKTYVAQQAPQGVTLMGAVSDRTDAKPEPKSKPRRIHGTPPPARPLPHLSDSLLAGMSDDFQYQ